METNGCGIEIWIMHLILSPSGHAKQRMHKNVIEAQKCNCLFEISGVHLDALCSKAALSLIPYLGLRFFLGKQTFWVPDNRTERKFFPAVQAYLRLTSQVCDWQAKSRLPTGAGSALPGIQWHNGSWQNAAILALTGLFPTVLLPSFIRHYSVQRATNTW